MNTSLSLSPSLLSIVPNRKERKNLYQDILHSKNLLDRCSCVRVTW